MPRPPMSYRGNGFREHMFARLENFIHDGKNPEVALGDLAALRHLFEALEWNLHIAAVSSIESDEYRQEVDHLCEDERIIAMAKEVDEEGGWPQDLRIKSSGGGSWIQLTGLKFISRASAEARRRGVQAHSIGAPARAITELLTKRLI